MVAKWLLLLPSSGLTFAFQAGSKGDFTTGFYLCPSGRQNFLGSPPATRRLITGGTRTKSFDHSQLQSGWEEGLGVGYLLQVPRQPEMELHPNGRKCVVPRQAGPSTIRFPGPTSNYYMISHFKASRTLHIFIDLRAQHDFAFCLRLTCICCLSDLKWISFLSCLKIIPDCSGLVTGKGQWENRYWNVGLFSRMAEAIPKLRGHFCLRLMLCVQVSLEPPFFAGSLQAGAPRSTQGLTR